MEAGDIPGAVRFFESAVQKEPNNQLVRSLQFLNLSSRRQANVFCNV